MPWQKREKAPERLRQLLLENLGATVAVDAGNAAQILPLGQSTCEDRPCAGAGDEIEASTDVEGTRPSGPRVVASEGREGTGAE